MADSSINTSEKDFELLEETLDKRNAIKDVPLFTVFILSYDNIDTLFESILSVLNQTYPRLELVICDDGTDYFSIAETRNYIINNCHDNLEHLVIRKFNKNQGTVRNAHDSLSRMNGDYYCTIGADDIFNDQWVVENYVDCFLKHPDTWWIIGRITVVAADYKTVLMTFPNDKDWNLLMCGDKTETLGFFTRSGMPDPGTCLKKGATELVGGIDLRYKLLEDWPIQFKLVKNNYYPVILNRYVIRQGSSGITKTVSINTLTSRRQYVIDKYNLFLNEIQPTYNKLPKHIVHQSKKYMKNIVKKQLYYDYDYKFSKGYHKLSLILKHPIIIKWTLAEKCTNVRSLARRNRITYSNLFLMDLISLLLSHIILQLSLDEVYKILFILPFLGISATTTLMLLFCILAEYNDRV